MMSFWFNHSWCLLNLLLSLELEISKIWRQEVSLKSFLIFFQRLIISPIYQFFSTWIPSIWLLSVFADVVSSISSPFGRLCQADHIAEGKARPQHREVHALLFGNSVWVLLCPFNFKGCETGSTVYSPYPRRLESLTKAALSTQLF